MAQAAMTDYERFSAESTENRRLLAQEQLIFEVAERLSEVLAERGWSQRSLATALDRTPAFVSQLLSGDSNLTLRTLADAADALDVVARFELTPRVSSVIAPFEWTQGGGNVCWMNPSLNVTGVEMGTCSPEGAAA